ncbi:LysR family transcriptional regulator [Antarctobacter sp.]|uniref:LysR family transcriptional regulator n=1 Tax=Antarctobacter sp. TaxID=1872577 RepID=UPI003A8F9D8D
MDLTQIKTLVHVAEIGSISKAAERLNTVQPALSRQIRLLEEELKVRLFERHGRGMRITPIGQEVLDSATRILTEIEAIRETVHDGSKSFRGEVRIGLTPTVADMMIAALARRLRADHPKLHVQFKTAFSAYLLDWLRRGELDLVVSYDPEPSRSLLVEPVLMESLFLVSRPGHGLSLNKPVPFADLKGKPFVLPGAGHALRTIFDNCTRLSGISVDTTVTADSMRAMLDLVRDGFGMTMLPLGPIFAEIDSGVLEAAPLTDPMPQRRLVMCLSADTSIAQATRHVAKVFREISADLVKRDIWRGQVLGEAAD